MVCSAQPYHIVPRCKSDPPLKQKGYYEAQSRNCHRVGSGPRRLLGLTRLFGWANPVVPLALGTRAVQYWSFNTETTNPNRLCFRFRFCQGWHRKKYCPGSSRSPCPAADVGVEAGGLVKAPVQRKHARHVPAAGIGVEAGGPAKAVCKRPHARRVPAADVGVEAGR